MGKQYAVYITIAFIIGGIISTWLMNKWLQDFAYRTNIGIVSYLIPFLILTIVTLTTVYLIVSRAAHANPVRSLRYE